MTQRPVYDFWHHSDAGLLREPPGSFNWERWFPPWPEWGRPGYWATIQVNPFGDSMSIIDEDAAKQLIGDGDPVALHVARQRANLREHEST
jgi:hypothetical protein